MEEFGVTGITELGPAESIVVVIPVRAGLLPRFAHKSRTMKALGLKLESPIVVSWHWSALRRGYL